VTISDNVQAIAYTEDVNVDVAIPGLWIGADAGAALEAQEVMLVRQT